MEPRKVVDNVHGTSGGLTTTGTLKLTDFHIIFSAPPPVSTEEPSRASTDSTTDVGRQPPKKHRETWIPYPVLSHCAFRPTHPTSGKPPTLRLRCRDFNFIIFAFDDEKMAREVFDMAKARTCRLGTIEKLFAFRYVPPPAERAINGWEVYDAKAEFRRQGISEKASDKGWRISSVNKNYSFCDTYPAVLAVPSSISDNSLKYARDFRTMNRIPALSYLHPVNNCSITRSSQPKAGALGGNYNVQDEKLVQAAFAALGSQSEGTSPRGSQDADPIDPPIYDDDGTILAPQLSQAESIDDPFPPPSPPMYDAQTGKRLIYGAQQSNLIVDARPRINATVNGIIKEGGTENMARYQPAKRVNLGIANIHIMRDSLVAVVDALKDADISPLPPSKDALSKTGWLAYIHSILAGAELIAKQIAVLHSHVLIHCSDGWDRTSQLSALAQIMLDPYYRTIEGFIVLIEKDFCSFGHMFRLRSGHLSHDKWFVIQKDGFAGYQGPASSEDSEGPPTDPIQAAFANFRGWLAEKNADERDLAPSEAVKDHVGSLEATSLGNVSPVFHQFLDCVYQLQRQHPTRFEFNERFLKRILYHLHSCQYGTFLYNSEKQRHDARAEQRTSSVWGYFLSRKQEFANPGFDVVIDDRDRTRERVIYPNLKDIRWWYQVFNRSDDEMNSSLDAAAKQQSNLASAVAALEVKPMSKSQPATPGRVVSPPPRLSCGGGPALQASQSVTGTAESVHAALAPDISIMRSLHRSVSAEEITTQATPGGIEESIANRAKGFLTDFRGPSPHQQLKQAVSDQELQSMT